MHYKSNNARDSLSLNSLWDIFSVALLKKTDARCLTAGCRNNLGTEQAKHILGMDCSASRATVPSGSHWIQWRNCWAPRVV